MTRVRVLCWGCSSLAVLACSGGADVPNTPDLSGLEAEYDRPTAVLDATNVVDALRDMPSLPDLVAGFRAAGYATQGVDTASIDAHADNFNIQGSLHVTLRCPGELEPAVYGPNGAFDLTLGVKKNLIRRGISGDATHCVVRGSVLGQPIRVEVDGPVSFDLGRDLGLRQRWSGRLLMKVSGTISIGSLVLDNLSARWTNDRVEYLHTLPDGSTVVALVTADGAVAVRDKQVIWGCSDNQTCAAQ